MLLPALRKGLKQIWFATGAIKRHVTLKLDGTGGCVGMESPTSVRFGYEVRLLD